MIKIREIERKIIDLYKTGLTHKQVAELTGYSKSGVQYILNKYNIPSMKHFMRQHTLNDSYFDVIDTEEKAYILGFLMADGNVMGTNNVIQMTLQSEDRYMLERINTIVQSDYPVLYTKNNTYSSFKVASPQWVNALSKLNVVPRKSLILEPPEIPHELYRHLIRGYFDGDGSIWLDVSVNTYAIQFIGTKSVLERFKKEMNWKDNKLRLAKKGNTDTYRLGYRGNILVSEMLTELYKNSTIYLNRKYEKYLKCVELKEYNEQHKKQIWINNLGSYICKNIQ